VVTTLQLVMVRLQRRLPAVERRARNRSCRQNWEAPAPALWLLPPWPLQPVKMRHQPRAASSSGGARQRTCAGFTGVGDAVAVAQCVVILFDSSILSTQHVVVLLDPSGPC
jgi:hypothetical protein